MKKGKFFFDTADEYYIQDIWAELESKIPGFWVYGATTNPNALSKIDVKTLDRFEQVVNNLCRLITKIRNKEPGGLVFVQVPNTKMTHQEMSKWVEYINELDDGVTRVGLKIPHFTYALDNTWDLSELISINVTGISDWGTIFKVFQYPVEFASIIPGRMEEKELDANAHLEFIRTDRLNPKAKVIAGSMRTIRGLQDAIARDTIPTIGARVWKQFFEAPELWNGFKKMWDLDRRIDLCVNDWTYCPVITPVNVQLSVDFFNQMDSLGEPLFNEFCSFIDKEEK